MNVITRIWHGTTKAEHAGEYLKLLADKSAPDFHSIDGNLSCKVLRRVEGDICQFIVAIEWNSYESIKEFAGDDSEKVSCYPADKAYLLIFEEHIAHYETFRYAQNRSECQ